MARKKQEFIRFKEVNCPALNVRSNPSTTGGLIIKILPKGKIVECDKNFNNKEWDHIVAEPNIEGYCMKQFLAPISQDILTGFHMAPIAISINSKCDATNDKENDDGDEEKE